ncbi:MAG: DUF4384 domain-containing protein [Planctomycetales bacterium]|nr:DUF4384 domain-containing protein [Planctomycetales bacterium]
MAEDTANSVASGAAEAGELVQPGDELVSYQPGWLVNVAVNRTDGRYVHGERLSVRFKSERAARVYVIYHQADAQSLLIYPNVAQPTNAVAANTEVMIPAANDSFRFRVGPPYGQEAMQVIAAENPIAILDDLRPGAARATKIPQDVRQALATAIEQSPHSFAEHRIVIHTREADGVLAPERSPKRFGVFVGVDLLRDASFGDSTPLAKKSAELMHTAMLADGGVPEANSRLLIGEHATSTEWEDVMTKWLPSVSEPGDTVFLFYCGHGGQIKALDESEPEGLDEVLSTYDMDSKRIRETAVSDDRLARWLLALPGRQIVLLLETCHGGGVVDGRGMAGALRDEANRCHDIAQLNTVVVCACLPDEFSHFSPKLPASFMPLLFAQAMRDQPKPLSVQAAFDFYRKNLPKLLADEKIGANLPGFIQQPSLTDHALLPVLLAPAKPTSTPSDSVTSQTPSPESSADRM